jgi:hypothetical protein
MQTSFYWDAKSIAVEENVKNEVERHMEKALDWTGSSEGDKIRPCHLEDSPSVHLFQYNPLKNEAYGEIFCCCGDEVKRFAYNIDSKEITYY